MHREGCLGRPPASAPCAWPTLGRRADRPQNVVRSRASNWSRREYQWGPGLWAEPLPCRGGRAKSKPMRRELGGNGQCEDRKRPDVLWAVRSGRKGVTPVKLEQVIHKRGQPKNKWVYKTWNMRAGFFLKIRRMGGTNENISWEIEQKDSREQNKIRKFENHLNRSYIPFMSPETENWKWRWEN